MGMIFIKRGRSWRSFKFEDQSVLDWGFTYIIRRATILVNYYFTCVGAFIISIWAFWRLFYLATRLGFFVEYFFEKHFEVFVCDLARFGVVCSESS